MKASSGFSGVRRQLLQGAAATMFAGLPAARALAAEAPPPPALPHWPQAEPASEGFDAAGLAQALAEGASIPGLKALLVARNGRLVAESYYAGAHAGQLQAINSCTKSIASMGVGIALARGKLASLSQTVAELLPEEVARVPSSPARDVTLAQILTGTSGLAYDNQRDFLALLRAKDPVQWVLALPADGRTPGTWSYNDAAVSLLAPILERAYGQPLAEIATQELFAPLGIEQFRAVRDGAGRVPTYHGLSLLPRDLLKAAWTMLDGGAWQGRQVVPPSWVAQSTQPAVDGSWPLGPIGRSRYAMLWFTGRLQGRPVTWAWGYGGQFAWLVPSLRLAVVSAATSPPPRELGQQTVAIANLLARVVGTAA